MKLINYLFIFIFLSFTPSMSENPTGFKAWKDSFKKTAIENNVSEETFDTVMANIKFLPNVIKYDRYQPEFYEDTKTYISKSCLLYTSPSPRDLSTSRMPSSA